MGNDTEEIIQVDTIEMGKESRSTGVIAGKDSSFLRSIKTVLNYFDALENT